MLSRSASRISRSVFKVNYFSESQRLASTDATLPPLSYGYKDLEPFINAEIMEIHHSKHHNTYITNLNAAMKKLVEAEATNDIGAIVELQGSIKFNGGGHINHSIFWKNLAPKSSGGGVISEGPLKNAIETQFGSMDAMKDKLVAAAVGVQGSGWGWLGYDKVGKRLVVTTTSNQDPLQPTTGLVPLLGIDVWEHAYYLQYKNVRATYVKEIFNVINWKDVESRFKKAIAM